MTRQDVLNSYNVDENGMIVSPGKFEAEMIYVPYFYDAYLGGMADDDDGKILSFNVTDDDKKEFPELQGIEKIELWESDNGFIFSDVFPAKKIPA